MRGAECIGDLRRRSRTTWASGSGPCASRFGQRLTGHVLHHEVRRALVLADVVDGADVGVVERGDRLGLALEAGATVGVGGEVGGSSLIATVRSRRVSRAR